VGHSSRAFLSCSVTLASGVAGAGVVRYGAPHFEHWRSGYQCADSAQSISDLQQIYQTARQNEVEFNLAYIGSDINYPHMRSSIPNT
jgi:hypothetical protein